MTRKVIDVSAYQINIDWSLVANECDMVIFRCFRKGLKDDETFEEGYKDAKAAGLGVGVYWYSYANSLEEVEEEAKLAAEKAYKCNAQYVFMDLEGEFMRHYYSFVKLAIDRADSIIRGQHHMRFGVYCNKSYFDNIKNAWDGPWWIARYNSKLGCSIDDYIVGWQYTSQGRVDGIAGNVDISEWYGEIICGEKEKPATTRVLQYAQGTPIMKGSDVEDLQIMLNDAVNANIKEDGKFGPATEAAVKGYQMLRGLVVDGKAGPKTVGELEKEC